jgi:hypothetical protein
MTKSSASLKLDHVQFKTNWKILKVFRAVYVIRQLKLALKVTEVGRADLKGCLSSWISDPAQRFQRPHLFNM